MKRRLPSLNSLRSFEATARHLSLTLAADELCVTPAAISHHMKSLESYLGVKLFSRNGNLMVLTDVGKDCLPGLTEAFDRLAEVVSEAQDKRVNQTLKVIAPPTLCSKWLAPRLAKFSKICPEFDVQIHAQINDPNLTIEDVDVGILYGCNIYKEYYVNNLTNNDIIFPVCSPKLLEGKTGLQNPGNLHHYTLLHIEKMEFGKIRYPNWQMWLDDTNMEGCDATRGPVFSVASMATQAAVDGHGVALSSKLLVADDLASGRLVRPFDYAIPVALSYNIVCQNWMAKKHKIVAFRKWLHQEYQDTLFG